MYEHSDVYEVRKHYSKNWLWEIVICIIVITCNNNCYNFSENQGLLYILKNKETGGVILRERFVIRSSIQYFSN